MDSKEKIIDFKNVIGLEEAKTKLKENIILPVEYPILYEGNRAPGKWTLLYGPPGAGKSYLATAVETELISLKKQNNFFPITFDKFLNKSLEERIKILNELFQQARNNKPSAVFIDEMDSILKYKKEEKEDNKKFLDEFFRNIRDPFSNEDNAGIVILGATNKPWDLEPFIRRRFQRLIYVDLPEANDRKLLIKYLLEGNNINITEEQFEKIVNLTQDYSRKDIYNIIQDIISEKNKKSKPCITFEDFSLSIEKIKPSIDKQYFEMLDNFRKEYVN